MPYPRYILGRDPKPYPPPMKITKDMVEAMGGQQSEEMRRFRSHCFSAFLILRKNGNLILNLFALMVDSNVQVRWRAAPCPPSPGLADVHRRWLCRICSAATLIACVPAGGVEVICCLHSFVRC